MSKKLSILLSLVLAVSVLITFAGCGESQKQQAPDNAAESSSTTTEPTTTAETVKPEVTLTLYGPYTGGTSGVQESNVFKVIHDKLNIKIDIDFTYTVEKFKTMMATNALTDICFFSDPSISFDQFIKSGLALELDELIETNGQNILKYAPEMVVYSRTFQSDGTNKLYFINHQVSKNEVFPEGTHLGPCIRWDYYKEIGAPVMKSDRDFVDVVAQILEKFPTNEDGKKNVGLSLWSDWGKWTPFCWGAYAKNLCETYWPLTLCKETNEIVEVYGDNGQFKQGIEFMNYAYRKGILDPDSFTQKVGDVIAKANTAQIIATVLNLGDEGTKYLESKGLTGKGYTTRMTPVSIQGSKNAFFYYTPTGRTPHWLISNNTKYPDRCMDFLNLLFDPEFFFTAVNGLKDEDWVVDADGNYRYTDLFYQRIKEPGPDQLNKYGYGFMSSWSFSPGETNPITGKPFSIQWMDPSYNEKSFNTVNRDMLEFYNAETPLDLIKMQYPHIPRDNSSVAWNAFSATSLPDELKLIDTNIGAYLDKQYVKLTMCETEEEFNVEYEKTLAELDKLGIQELKDFLLPKLQEALKMQEEFYESAK
jgi:putative aldouronate transport system substrate-binding protein